MPKMEIISSFGMSVPSIALIFSHSKGTLTGSLFFGYTSTTPPTASPAPNSSMSSQARFIARIAEFGSRPLSNFWDASVWLPSLFDVRRMLVPSKLAASKSTVFTLSVIMEFSPPMMPAMPTDFSASQIISMRSSSSCSWPSRVTNFSPCSALRTIILWPAIVS